jgi:hypothetical protein
VRRPTLLSLTITASLVSSSLVLPEVALAGAPAASEDPAFTEAKSLYKEGEIKFQTADYEEALALWKRAFAILPDGDEHRSIRHALVYNIAEAHSRAYEVSRNPTHLRKAKILLDNYRADHRALYGDEPNAVTERAEVDDRIAELDRQIAQSEAAGEASTPINDEGTITQPAQPQPQPQPQPPPKPLTPNQQWEAEVKADPVLGPKWAQSSKRIVGGAVLTGIGSGIALISILAFVSAPGASDGLFPRALWITGGITGAIALGLLIPGAVLLGTGVATRREVLKAKPKPIGTLAPMLTPGGGGLGFVGRF